MTGGQHATSETLSIIPQDRSVVQTRSRREAPSCVIVTTATDIAAQLAARTHQIVQHLTLVLDVPAAPIMII